MLEVRCKNCGRLIFKMDIEGDVYVELKCPKCKSFSKWHFIKTE